MLRKQIIAKLFRLCLKLTQRRRFELHSSNRPQRSVDVFCVSLNFVKHKIGVTAWKLRLSKLLQHLSAGRVLESDSSLIIMIQFRLGYGWLVLIDFRRTYVQTHKLGLFSLLLQKQTKKKHILVLTLCSRSLSHTMKLTARHRQLIQREAISPAGGAWRGIGGSPCWIATRLCNTLWSRL